jgi:3-deoxy-D-manno-octulosonic-acid transferase
MATSGRYRAGLAGRLGLVPKGLRAAVAGRDVVWVHAVSVGEAMAATRLVAELEAVMGDGWAVVVSTTTATGQALARERFGADRVFYYPLDLGWAVWAYRKALRPRLLVLMESELWPRMLVECERAGVPVAVVNARVSDRSFARGVRVRAVWQRMLRRVGLFLVQSDEDARRWTAMGARADAVRVTGNLKYDVRAPKQSRVAELVREAAAGRPILVAGSTVGRKNSNSLSEDEIVIQAWEGALRRDLGVMLVLAPRHPERFGEVKSVAMEFRLQNLSEVAAAKEGNPPFAKDAKDGPPDWQVAAAKEGNPPFAKDAKDGPPDRPVAAAKEGNPPFAKNAKDGPPDWQGAAAKEGNPPDWPVEIVLLDTIGDLAAVYAVADVAFVGGSLVPKGGHNPLEPARFGVPVVMGPSYENFRDVVERMRTADGILIVQNREEFEAALIDLLKNRERAVAIGERGRGVFEAQAGATARTVDALMVLLQERSAAAR